MTIGIRVTHPVHGAGIVVRIVRVHTGKTWLVVKMDSGVVQPRPVEEWTKEAMD